MSVNKFEVRAQELLADLPQAIYHLGASTRTGDHVLRILEESGVSAQRLRQLNTQLLPLLACFAAPETHRRWWRWWRWFTGAELERDIGFTSTCQKIDTLAKAGVTERVQLSDLYSRLQSEHQTLGIELQLIEVDVGAAKILLGSTPVGITFAQAIGEEGIQRFTRKLSNVEAMLTAMQLTRAQYMVAARHAREMSDRFDEIKTMLLPLWYQRMGFELFSQRINADGDAAEGSN